MKNFFLAVLVLICVSLAAFLPGLAWGHYSARRTVASNDKIAELVLSKAYVSYNQTVTFACDGREYSYQESTGLSGTRETSRRVPFFDNYEQVLNYLLFGNGVLISNAAVMGQSVARFSEKQKALLFTGSVAVAAWGFAKGYQVGFERSLDCSKIADSLNAGLWKSLSAKLEKQAEDSNPLLKFVNTPALATITPPLPKYQTTASTPAVIRTPLLLPVNPKPTARSTSDSISLLALSSAQLQLACLDKLPPSSDVAVCLPPSGFTPLSVRPLPRNASSSLQEFYKLNAANATR